MAKTKDTHVADCKACGMALTINDFLLTQFMCPHCEGTEAVKPKVRQKPTSGTIFKWSEVYEGPLREKEKETV